MDYFSILLIIFPVVVTWVVYKISMNLNRHKWRAIHTAVNWATIFFMIAVVILLKLIFDYYFFGIILGLLLTILAIIMVVQWKTKTEVILIKGIKVLWRFCFLFFLFLYGCFIIIWMVQWALLNLK